MSNILSYKDWKLVNESFGPAMTLGLKTLPSMGLMGQHTQTGTEIKEEKCSKCGSKMLGKSEPKTLAPKKDKAGKPDGKPLGKKLGHEPEEPEVDDEVEDDGMGGDEDGMGDEVGGGAPVGGDDDFGSTEDDGEGADFSDDDGEEGEEDLGGEEGEDFGGEEGGDDAAKDDAASFVASLTGKDGKGKGKGKGKGPIEIKRCCTTAKMKAEEAWWNSVHDMIDVTGIDKKNWDGFSEDALYSPKNPNEDVTEPGPGEPGFAPQARIGGFH